MSQLELAVEPCWWCDRPHAFLCDTQLRGSGDVVTCDAPMCAVHAREIGRGHVCVRGGKGRGCETFEIHRCPYCEDNQGRELHKVQVMRHREGARAHGQVR